MSRKRGVPIGSALSRSDRIGTVRTGESARAGFAAAGGADRGRGTRGGVVTRLKDDEGPRRARCHSRQQEVPYLLLLLNTGASEWRCGLKTASSSGAPESQARETDAVGPVGSTESVPCSELREGIGWATDVVVAGGSAEPSLTEVGTAKTEAKSLSAARETHPRPGELSMVATNAETRATNLLEGVGWSSSLIRGPCARKSQKSARVKGSPPNALHSVRSISPPKPISGIGEEGLCSLQALMRYMPPSSTGVRLVAFHRGVSSFFLLLGVGQF